MYHSQESRHYKYIIRISLSLLLIFAVTDMSISATDSAPWTGYRLDGAPCKGKRTTYGPFDYRKRQSLSTQLGLVEGAHFNENVENLKEGAKHKYNLYGDIDYTLRAFPNHYRALYTTIRLRTLEGRPYQKKGLEQPECYLNRAIKFTPGDPTVYSLYGILLHKLDRFNEALEKYLKAQEINPNDIQTKYNIGLLLCEMKRFDEAKKYALEVYNNNYPLNGLKNRLIKSGHWQ